VSVPVRAVERDARLVEHRSETHGFHDHFNDLVDKISTLTQYDSTTNSAGFGGDSTFNPCKAILHRIEPRGNNRGNSKVWPILDDDRDGSNMTSIPPNSGCLCSDAANAVTQLSRKLKPSPIH